MLIINPRNTTGLCLLKIIPFSFSNLNFTRFPKYEHFNIITRLVCEISSDGINLSHFFNLNILESASISFYLFSLSICLWLIFLVNLSFIELTCQSVCYWSSLSVCLFLSSLSVCLFLIFLVNLFLICFWSNFIVNLFLINLPRQFVYYWCSLSIFLWLMQGYI